MGRRAAPETWTGAGAGPEGGSRGAGLPLGLTVDELRWYSRRRPNDLVCTRDNLCVESGSLKDVTSEYGYSFRPPALVARSLVNLSGSGEEDKENINMRRCLSHSEDLVGKSVSRASHRARLRPRGDLRPEGDMLFHTEKRDQFIEYVFSKRPDLLRRDTQLKLEGDLNTLTENRDKFILFENCKRPPLAKHDCNLQLEGDFLHLPEYKELFVEFPRHRPVVKKPEQELHVNTQGKMDVYSETFSQFIEHALSGARPEMMRRPTNLKCEGEIDLMPEYTKSFQQFPIERRSSLKHSSNLKLGEDLYSTLEYKDKYIGLPVVKQTQSKHEDNLILDENNSKTEAVSGYIPSHTDLLVKPEASLPVSTDTAVRERPPTPRRTVSPLPYYGDLRPYLDDHKTSSTSNKARLIPKPPKSPEERVTARPPRARPSRANSIIRNDQRNDHRDHTFEVLNKGAAFETRPSPMKEDNSYIYRPSSRRASISSVQSNRRRSDSPSYRLHVTNVDEPKKGFGSRDRSDTKRYPERKAVSPSRSSQPREMTDTWRTMPNESGRRQWSKNSYVPDAGPISHDYSKDKSFVVLDRNNHRGQAVTNITSSRWYRHPDD